MAAKKTNSTKTVNKSAFIRSQPATLSAAEVVAKAKAAGVTVRPGLVYEVRRTAKATKGVTKKTPTATKKAASDSTAKMSKADFVRARRHLSPNEIVEDARAAGLKFAVQYVYNVRRQDLRAGKEKRGEARGATAPSAAASSAENLLKAVAAEIGLGRAVEILAGERARVRAVIRG